ncbi:hypothetical protein E2562_026793 [Oryza meyeriana var. granulata]|uniref:Uncharacterized protein n=1 Tax=Oryza meyeriana var. granulata TaxID=110450 RepID=A0A6G1CRW1_9ORYZ|nr:hypothetical protein E2562_026793 [Oryza meyeriana var. granulata]
MAWELGVEGFGPCMLGVACSLRRWVLSSDTGVVVTDRLEAASCMWWGTVCDGQQWGLQGWRTNPGCGGASYGQQGPGAAGRSLTLAAKPLWSGVG